MLYSTQIKLLRLATGLNVVITVLSAYLALRVGGQEAMIAQFVILLAALCEVLVICVTITEPIKAIQRDDDQVFKLVFRISSHRMGLFISASGTLFMATVAMFVRPLFGLGANGSKGVTFVALILCATAPFVFDALRDVGGEGFAGFGSVSTEFSYRILDCALGMRYLVLIGPQTASVFTLGRVHRKGVNLSVVNADQQGYRLEAKVAGSGRMLLNQYVAA